LSLEVAFEVPCDACGKIPVRASYPIREGYAAKKTNSFLLDLKAGGK